MTKKNDWLVIATGSNIGDKLKYLQAGQEELKKFLDFVAQSEVFTSKAVGYTDQPDFYNQVLEFKIPDLSPDDVMQQLLDIEKKMGRSREIFQGPRTLDLDIILWGKNNYQTELVQIPHPRFAERSFVVEPLKQLPCFQEVKKYFKIPDSFTNTSKPI